MVCWRDKSGGRIVKIYVASSWRNQLQQWIVQRLRIAGYEVYDFRNPAPGNEGFHWSALDPGWESWGPKDLRKALTEPIAEAGFALDKGAMDWADAGVLVLPCGRSAHLEAGYMAGQGKRVVPLMVIQQEPELMYKLLGPIATNWPELIAALEVFA